LRARCRAAVNAFGAGNVVYATKAFICGAMARLAHEEGLLLDVATGGELHTVLHAGVPASSCVLHGNNKSLDELRMAIAAGIDHIVVNTPDLERTSNALHQATGAELKRIRDAGNGMRQGFHRLGDVIIEIVSAPSMPAGNASLWGFVLNVADVNDVAAYLGPDVLSPPKPAVQKNRLIATFRGAVGLGVPVALMSDI
jgi:hypothetical protein